MAIDGINNADLEIKRNWRTESLSEVRNNMEEVEEQAPEVATWAREMAAATNVADTITYEMTGGTPEAFTEELNNITNDNIAINELPESGQAATPEAVQNPPETEPEEENPELGPEDQVQPEVNTIAPPENEEVPKEDEFSPEEEEKMRKEVAELNPDLEVNSMSLEEILKRLGRYGMTTE